MLSIWGRKTRLCDGITRREALRLGGLSALGLSLPDLLAARSVRAADRRSSFGRARSCILLWMTGGPPQHETWDPKPDAPAEIRGPFQPIPTNVPGIQVGELMPRLAHMLDKLCVLRGVHTDNPSHPGSSYEMLTGNLHPLGKGRDDVVASRNDWPVLGAIVKRFKPARPGIPTAVTLPEPIFNVPFYPGQDAGFLGPEWDPWRLGCDPSAVNYQIPELVMPAEISGERLGQRRHLLERVGQALDQKYLPLTRFHSHTVQAFDLLTGPGARRAFNLSIEPPALRDRYGRHKFGQGCLLARRLVEAGVALVQVNWHREANDDTPMWDAHWRLEENLKSKLMPPMDQGVAALLEDLDARGLLDETLVVWMGEFGRTPKLEYVAPHPAPGRNHWGHVFSLALAGAGIRGGQVYGASDKIGGYPKDGAVSPADLTATLFHCLGLAPGTEIRDRLDRPQPISRGQVLERLFA